MEEINIFPKAGYCHYVKILEPSKVIQWWFSTRKHTIAFGLFFCPYDSDIFSANFATSSELQSEHIDTRSLNSDRARTKRADKHLSFSAASSEKSLSALQDRLGLSKLKSGVVLRSKSKTDSTLNLPEKDSSRNDKLTLNSGQKRNSRALDLKHWETLIPIQMYHSSKSTIKSQWFAENLGVYLLYFSNDFSIRNSKVLTLCVTVIDSKTSIVSNPQIVISGWLVKKKKKRIQGWAKRWVWIQNRTLMYATTQGGIIRGKSLLSESIVSIEPTKRLIIIDSNLGPLVFRALTYASYEKWSTTLKNLIEVQDNGSIRTINTPCVSDQRNDSLDIASKAHIDFCDNISVIKNIFSCIDEHKNLSIPKSSNKNNESDQISSYQLNVKPNEETSDHSHLNNQRGSIRSLLSKVKIKSDNHQKSNEQTDKSFSFNNKLLELQTHILNLSINENLIYSCLQRNTDNTILQSENTFDESESDRQLHLIGLNRSHDSLSEIFYDTNEVLQLVSENTQSRNFDLQNQNNDCFSILENSEDDECFEAFNEEYIDYESESPSDQPKKAAKNGNTVFRSSLPSNEPKGSVNIVSILRKNIGKDLSQVRMPIQMNEPLVMTQTICEELKSSYLLDKAASLSDSLDRLMYVVGFAISAYAPRKYRVSYKPFNPIIGETYQLVRPDLGFRFISEKVSHHPLVIACHAESQNYIFWQDSNVKPRFWGRSMEFTETSLSHVEIPAFGDHFTYNKATTILKGILTGNKSIEFNGKIEVKNETTGDVAILTFKESTMFASSDDKIEGVITSSNPSIPIRKIYGKWSESIHCETPQGTKLIWETDSNDREVTPNQYGFGTFAVTSNQITDDLKNPTENQKYLLPNTDSRLRPDLRLYEEGNVTDAEIIKNKLEDAQRTKNNELAKRSEKWVPKWFELTTDPSNSSLNVWRYKGGYWNNSLENTFDKAPFFIT
ncbi:hypothetical protein BB561_002146 [Smittium simulii]|uniref:PH domain-containing protein n=1 Tax=Smittium simulii TaxID=133385 RepID=A0A2T9YRL3_9FUNG|nr:hypothetical protein BB561_002146 [Smittium simulii]